MPTDGKAGPSTPPAVRWIEVTGKPAKIEEIIQIMTELGLVEVSRTGVAAIGRGPTSL